MQAPNVKFVKDELFVESVRKAFIVIDLLNDMERPLRLSEIAELAGIGKSATQRFVHTLTVLGYLHQNTHTKTYSLSPRILTYARGFLKSSQFHSCAKPILQDLAELTGETVNLSEISGSEIVLTIRFPSIHTVSVNLDLGSRLPVFNTAPGRAIISNWTETKAQQAIDGCDLQPWTPTTVTDPDKLRETLRSVRKAGYAFTNQEAFMGDLSIAAPIFSFDGDCSAAVNIAVPSPRWSKEDFLTQLLPHLLDAANKISQELGYSEKAVE